MSRTPAFSEYMAWLHEAPRSMREITARGDARNAAVYELREVEGRSFRAIADEFGVSVTRARQMYFKHIRRAGWNC